MKLESLRELFITELQDTYDAEQQIVKSLPKMMEKCSHEPLKQGFQMHLDQTRQQVNRLERCFQQLGYKARGEHCDGMEGIIKEGEHLVKKGGDPSAIDAGLIASAQKVEHYEIASYGTLCTYAEMLGENECLNLLKQTLAEEKETDKKLTDLAMRMVNVDAVRAAGGQMQGREF